jgi:hypothetical protein
VTSRECCHAVDGMRTAGGGPHARSLKRRSAKAAGWTLPSVVIVMMPKCPACVAAYVAIATGAGISVSMAAHLRVMVLALCALVLLGLAAKPLLRAARG